MNRFEAIQMFVRIAEKGSFSAIAKERGIGQPAVSRQISALEAELGTKLIYRTSRSITLTESGRVFYQSALRLLDDLETATSTIGGGQTDLEGLIRIAAPPTFARLHMVPKLPAFFAAYPGVAVELAASQDPSNQDPSKILEDGFDLAIHSGNLPDATLVTRRFAETKIILVATPEYLSKHGTPNSPEDLPRFPGILFLERGAIVPWLFGTEPEETHIVPAGPFRTSDAEQMRMAVLEHLGMAQAPAWLFASELKAGTLRRLFPSLERRVPMFTVRGAGRHLPAKVRVFVEHLEKTFAMCSQFNPNPFSRTL